MRRTRLPPLASTPGRVLAQLLRSAGLRVAPVFAALLLGTMGYAAADSLPLRSGRVLEVQSIRVLGESLNVTVRTDGDEARVEIAFDQVEPRALLRILDAQAGPSDGRALLRSARHALGEGLREEAVLRFLEAARIDPDLGAERDAGLAAIRKAEARDALADLEQRVRSGANARGAALLAVALLDSVYVQSLTPTEQRQVEALGALARKMMVRETERKLLAQAKAAGAAAASDPKGFANPAPPAVLPPALPAGPAPSDPLAPLRANLAKADHAREAAADPAVPLGEATRHLEVAARELLQGRRTGRTLRPEALAEDARLELEELGLDLRAWLVATYLELADLYRQQQLFDDARARVRAVLLLDPGNEEAWSQRRLIEDDLRTWLESVPERLDPYRYTIRSGVSFGWYSPSPYWGGCLPCARAVPYGSSWAGGRFGFRTFRRR